jgi:hypothetical protein
MKPEPDPSLKKIRPDPPLLLSVTQLEARDELGQVTAVKGTSRVARWIKFSDQKFQFGHILMNLETDLVGIYTYIWNSLRPFGIFCSRLIFFPVLVVGTLYQEKSGNRGKE